MNFVPWRALDFIENPLSITLFICALILFWQLNYNTYNKSEEIVGTSIVLQRQKYRDEKITTFDFLKDINESLNCPVSSLLHTSIDGIHTYPIDIFDKPLHSNFIKLAKHNKSLTELIYKCSSTEGFQDHPIVHSCPEFKIRCPVFDKYVDIAMNKTKQWPSLHNLCSVYESFSDPSTTINVIIIGGSTTMGSFSQGCCCSQQLNSNCNISSNFIDEICYNNRICTWSRYLYKFLKSSSLGKVNYVNLAQGGYTSVYMAENILMDLKLKGIQELTSNDIVFIDHSVNDGMIFTSKSKHADLIIGLENLIYRLFHYSKRNNWPSIILLEQWPFVNQYVSLESSPMSQPFMNRDTDYDDAYIKVAKKYKLPLWSYRDVVWSDDDGLFAYEKERWREFKEYLQFFHNKDYKNHHFPWFIHLYYADLIGSLMNYQFNTCSENSIATRSHDDMNLTCLSEVDDFRVYSRENKFCSATKPGLLYQSAIPNKGTLLGAFNMTPDNSWNISADKRDKFGWIDEGILHCPPNDLNAYASILTFHFDSKKSLLMFQDIVLIRIDYFRTYRNAGCFLLDLSNDLFLTIEYT